MQIARFLPIFNAAATVLPDMPWNANARVLLLAIAGQESNWSHREQIGGPARSYWQMEVEAVQEVMTRTTFMPDVCALLDVPAEYHVVYHAIAYQDVLAAWCARALLWLDPAPLPAVGDVQGAWDYYQRNWRPGKPGPDRWPSVYAQAAAALEPSTLGAAVPVA